MAIIFTNNKVVTLGPEFRGKSIKYKTYQYDFTFRRVLDDKRFNRKQRVLKKESRFISKLQSYISGAYVNETEGIRVPYLVSTPRNKRHGILHPQNLFGLTSKGSIKVSTIRPSEWQLLHNFYVQTRFPKSRSKNRNKKIKAIDPYNRFWQKIFLEKFIKNITTQKTFYFKKLKNLNFIDTKNLSNTAPKLTDSTLRMLRRTLIGWLTFNFFFNFKMSYGLIKNYFIAVNNKCTNNFLEKIEPFSIIRFNLTGSLLLIFKLLVWKLGYNNLQALHEKAFFKKLSVTSSAEMSYKLSEILLLPIYNFNEDFRGYFELLSPMEITFAQRFFNKQKKFGQGRLL